MQTKNTRTWKTGGIFLQNFIAYTQIYIFCLTELSQDKRLVEKEWVFIIEFILYSLHVWGF